MTNGVWASAFTPIGGATTSDVAVAAPAAGVIDVYLRSLGRHPGDCTPGARSTGSGAPGRTRAAGSRPAPGSTWSRAPGAPRSGSPARTPRSTCASAPPPGAPGSASPPDLALRPRVDAGLSSGRQADGSGPSDPALIRSPDHGDASAPPVAVGRVSWGRAGGSGTGSASGCRSRPRWRCWLRFRLASAPADVPAAEAVPFGVFVPEEDGDGLGLALGPACRSATATGCRARASACPVCSAGGRRCRAGRRAVGRCRARTVLAVGVGAGVVGVGVRRGAGGVAWSAARPAGRPTEPGGSVGVAIGGSGRGVPFGAGEPSIGAPPAYTAASAMTVSTYVVGPVVAVDRVALARPRCSGRRRRPGTGTSRPTRRRRRCRTGRPCRRRRRPPRRSPSCWG